MKKLIVIETYGLLTELRGIVGPCLYPQMLDVNIIKKLVDGGKIVKECDPEDPSNAEKRVRLTQRNFNKPNFNVTEVEVAVPEIPAVEIKEDTQEVAPVVEPSVNPDVVVEDNTITPATEVPTDDFRSNKKKK